MRGAVSYESDILLSLSEVILITLHYSRLESYCKENEYGTKDQRSSVIKASLVELIT